MPQCSAFGCNNRQKKGSNVYFFSFPTDIKRGKAWIHYCRRWDFSPSANHRLCSVHFSKENFDRDPSLIEQLGLQGRFRARLSPGAVPDIALELCSNLGGTESAEAIKRGAYEKRRKAEVLQEVFDNLCPPSPDQTSVLEDKENDPVTVESIGKGTGVQTDPPPRTTTKMTQACSRPPVKNRKHQTDTTITQARPILCTVGTQTDAATLPSISADDNSDMEDDLSSCADDQDREFDPHSDDDISSDDEVIDSENMEHVEMNYRLQHNTPPEEEKQFLVSETMLAELLSVCRYCCHESTPFIKSTRGTLIIVQSVCVNGHIVDWKSQTTHNSLPWSNLMTASAILCSGSNAAKALKMFQQMNVQMMSMRTYTRLQSLYVAPSVTMAWDSEQAELLQQIRGTDVILGGDGRCDSPGFSAKYGSYTMMDLHTKKILDFQLVQSNEVKGSTHMELEGLKRAITYLQQHVNIRELVTDRHTAIKKYMRTEQSDTQHLFDVWHVSKGIGKKLEAAAKQARGRELRPWIRSITNHIHWISATCDGNGELKSAKWMSILNHVCNQHDGHSSLYPKCEHDDIELDPYDREWIKKGSVPYKLMQKVIENKTLLPDVPKLSPVYQTYALEAYHSVVNHYAPKSTHFFYPAMLARLCIAALHYNENCSRKQAVTQEGMKKFCMVYPKSKKGTVAVVKPRKTEPTYDYILLVKQAIVRRRKDDCSSYSMASEDVSIVNDHIPAFVTSSFTQFDKQTLIQQHRSRFRRQ